jgi:hypothetical protein
MCTMAWKRRALAIAGSAVLFTTVSACSSGPGVLATNSPAAPAAEATPVNNRTYTGTDLEAILDTVNTTVKLDGSAAVTDGPKTDSLNADGTAVGADFTTKPAACSRFGYSNVNLVDLLGTAGVIVGTTSGAHLNLIVATISGTALPASLRTSFAASQTALLTRCAHMTITAPSDGTTVYLTIDNTLLPVKTDATQSLGFTEHSGITTAGSGGGSSSDTTWLEAIDGNLLVFATSVTDDDQTELERAVNATIAAAGG